MKTPHKHADILRAIADGYVVQHFRTSGKWSDCLPDDVFKNPDWIFRIKPEPKPDYSIVQRIKHMEPDNIYRNRVFQAIVTYSGETGEPIKVEIC